MTKKYWVACLVDVGGVTEEDGSKTYNTEEEAEKAYEKAVQRVKRDYVGMKHYASLYIEDMPDYHKFKMKVCTDEGVTETIQIFIEEAEV